MDTPLKQGHCQNLECGRIIAIQPGHRPRRFCSPACKQQAFRAAQKYTEEIRAGEQRDLQAEEGAQETPQQDEQQWPGLSPFAYTLLREIRETVGGHRGESLAWRAASLIQMERDGVYNQIYNDRTLLVLDIMKLAEQFDWPALTTYEFAVTGGLAAWSAFCQQANMLQLAFARTCLTRLVSTSKHTASPA